MARPMVSNTRCTNGSTGRRGGPHGRGDDPAQQLLAAAAGWDDADPDLDQPDVGLQGGHHPVGVQDDLGPASKGLAVGAATTGRGRGGSP